MAASKFRSGNSFGVFFRLNLIRKFSKTSRFDPHESVILRQPAVATTVPSVSPFPLKLETYLRLANIPYKNRFGAAMSAKGKIPWIEYKHDVVSDSNFCIKYLNEKFSVNLDAKLSAIDTGIGRSVLAMLEENTYWAMVYYRWIENTYSTVNTLFPTASPLKRRIIAYGGRRRAKNYLHGHGLGRHSRDEIYYIASLDLEAISGLLGDKPFLLGDEPTLVDTCAFGFLANFVWHDVNSPLNAVICENFENMILFCQRMKDRLWNDWDQEIQLRKKLAHK